MKNILKELFFSTKGKIPNKYELKEKEIKVLGLDKNFVLSFLTAKYHLDTSNDLLFDIIDDISKSALEPRETLKIKIENIDKKSSFSKYSSISKTTVLYQNLIKETQFLINLNKEFEGAF